MVVIIERTLRDVLGSGAGGLGGLIFLLLILLDVLKQRSQSLYYRDSNS